MKLFIDKDRLDEITLTYLEIYALNNPRNNNLHKLIYEFIINSDLLNNKTKIILNLHKNRDYLKAYDNLLIQSDITNSFYDKLSNQLIYIEFLKLVKNMIKAGALDKDKINDINDKFLNRIENNKLHKFIGNSQLNNYLGNKEKNADEIKEAFFKKRHKILKFFNINLEKINNLRLDKCDLAYISDEMNFCYKKILKILKVRYLFIYEEFKILF